MYLRELHIPFASDEVEALAFAHNQCTDGMLCPTTPRGIRGIGIEFAIESLTKCICDDRISDDGERSMLTCLDKIKNAVVAAKENKS